MYEFKVLSSWGKMYLSLYAACCSDCVCINVIENETQQKSSYGHNARFTNEYMSNGKNY